MITFRHNNYQKRVVIHQLRNSIPSSSTSITIGDKATGLAFPFFQNIVNNVLNNAISNTINSITGTALSQSPINATLSTYSIELIERCIVGCAFPIGIELID